MASLSEVIQPYVGQVTKPILDFLKVPEGVHDRYAEDFSEAIAGVAVGRGVNALLDITTDGWFNVALKGIVTSVVLTGSAFTMARGDYKLAREGIIAGTVMGEAFIETVVKNARKIVASAQSTVEAAKRGDIGKIGYEMVNKNTAAELSKFLGMRRSATIPQRKITTTITGVQPQPQRKLAEVTGIR